VVRGIGCIMIITEDRKSPLNTFRRYRLWHFQIYLDGQTKLRRLRLQLVELHVELLVSQQRLLLHVELLINRQRLLPLAELPTNLRRNRLPVAVLAVLGINNCLIVHEIPDGLFCRELFTKRF
jgi:hypothetical protein